MTTPDDKLSSREESKSLYFAMSEVAFGGTATGCKSTGTGGGGTTRVHQPISVSWSKFRQTAASKWNRHTAAVSKIDVIIVGRGSFFKHFFLLLTATQNHHRHPGEDDDWPSRWVRILTDGFFHALSPRKPAECDFWYISRAVFPEHGTVLHPSTSSQCAWTSNTLRRYVRVLAERCTKRAPGVNLMYKTSGLNGVQT